MSEMKQIYMYDTIIGDIVKNYDTDFSKIRVFQKDNDPDPYFMASDVIYYIRGSRKKAYRDFKKFNTKEIIKHKVPVNNNAPVYLFTKYGLISCLSICTKNTIASIALREFIYIIFDNLEKTKLEYLKILHNDAMNITYIQDEIQKIDDDKIGGIVYFIIDTGSGFIKIGRTYDDVEIRLSSLQVGNPNKLLVCRTIQCNSIIIEKELHKKYNEFHIRGEWFNITIDEINTIII